MPILAPMATVTVRDRLLHTKYSHDITNREHIADLVGEIVSERERIETIIREGRTMSRYPVGTDSGNRQVELLAWKGHIFYFIYAHPDDPRANDNGAWHGDGLLRAV